jgi:cytoskeleton protein RodZ
MAADRTGDFGRRLRDARERRGISLRQIANATKISVAVLEALERNDISRLPGGIFSRAFVRSYAIEVGLDPDETIQNFIAQFPHDAVAAGHSPAEPIEDNEALESDRRIVATFFRLFAISVPIAVAILYFGNAGRTATEPATAQPPASGATTVTPAADVFPPPSPSPEATTAALPPSAPPSAPPAAPAQTRASVDDRLTIGLSVTRPCWVSAMVDGQKSIERLLQPGDQSTMEVRRELVLTAGDASALTMTVNGAETKPLGKAGEVVTARVNLTNFKDYLQAR